MLEWKHKAAWRATWFLWGITQGLGGETVIAAHLVCLCSLSPLATGYADESTGIWRRDTATNVFGAFVDAGIVLGTETATKTRKIQHKNAQSCRKIFFSYIAFALFHLC